MKFSTLFSATLLSLSLIGNAALAADVAYVTGGIGDEEMSSTKSDKNNFNTQLLFTDKAGHYRADVQVSITSKQGEAVLNAENAGPLFYTTLPAGKYALALTVDGKTTKRQLTVSNKSKYKKAFRF